MGLAGYPKKLDAEGIRRLIYDAWKIQGVITVNRNREEKNQPFKSSHGFRKYFSSKCEQIIKSVDVEILLGHGASKRGLKANYYRPKEDYLLEQYLKCVDYLTIDPSNKLFKKVNILEQKIQDKDYMIKGQLQELQEVNQHLMNEQVKRDKQIEELNSQMKDINVAIGERFSELFQQYGLVNYRKINKIKKETK
ncbi:MAG TPA: hypothetical protein VJ697_15960 [Nitrososphaeraceae archaeon]|nr:hypothetical protein [Nitrososphaeraceae archaeon]